MGVFLCLDGVVVRETVFEDLERFAVWERKGFVREFMSIGVDRCYEEVVSEFYFRLRDDCCMDLTIVDELSGALVGRIFLSRFDFCADSCDLTRLYVGEEAFLGKGYAKKAMLAVLRFLFEVLGMNRVTLDFFDGNVRAARLYESIGFVHEGRLRQCAKRDGEFFDLNLMSILRSEFLGL